MADLSDKDRAAAQAIEEALRRKTVGIVSGSSEHFRQGLGTGAFVSWRGVRLILTAGHVLDNTRRQDLAFLMPANLTAKSVTRDEILNLPGTRRSTLQPVVSLSVRDVIRDDRLDLAVVLLDDDPTKAFPATEFFELEEGGGSPIEGERLWVLGFPHDLSRVTTANQGVVHQHAEWTSVAPDPTNLDGFDAKRHLVAPYLSVDESPDARPEGLSGAAMWFRRPTATGVWHANLDIGGLTVTYYRTRKLLKAVRRERLEEFLDADRSVR